MHLLERLRHLNQPISVAIIGVGAMGKGLYYQALQTPGIRCVGVADLVVDRATQWLDSLGTPWDIAESVDQARRIIASGRVAVCQDGQILCRLDDEVNVVIESTSAIIEAANFAVTALEHRKHLILMNAEIDLIFGPALMRLARENGVAYASCDGDQHGVIKRVIDEMVLWGFEPIMAGNIKGFLDRDSNPIKIIPEADKRKLDHRMCCAYTDGTKLNIEMSLVANALGYSTDVVGMHGPKCKHVDDVLKCFDFDAIRRKGVPVVDYILGAQPGGGIYAVGHCNHPYQMDMMNYYKMGSGPYYVFYRPYHLCHVEAMRCVAEAALDGQSLLEPVYGFRTNVFAYAKKDLRAGDMLDGIGGHCCYGLIENCDRNNIYDGLPICLTEHVTLTRDIAKGERLTFTDVTGTANRYDYELYHRALADQQYGPQTTHNGNGAGVAPTPRIFQAQQRH